MTSPAKEFHMCVLGRPLVGKTSIMHRLGGAAFNRKNASKPSTGEVATKYSIEVPTSAGIILFHFYDWAWEQKRRDENINQQLMRGSNGALYVFDVTERRSLSDFADFADWFQRAAGFDKPWVIISNKNDQKKRAIQETDGPALARKGDNRAYAAISLVDDSGIDEMMLTIAKLMTKDPYLTMTGPFQAASEATMVWSNERETAAVGSLGLGMPIVKTHRVLLLVLNKSVVEKFNDMLVPTEYVLEVVGSVAECEEQLLASQGATAAATEPGESSGADTASSAPALPVHSLLLPPTASDTQKEALSQLAARHAVGCVVSVPRNLLEALSAINKK